MGDTLDTDLLSRHRSSGPGFVAIGAAVCFLHIRSHTQNVLIMRVKKSSVFSQVGQIWGWMGESLQVSESGRPLALAGEGLPAGGWVPGRGDLTGRGGSGREGACGTWAQREVPGAQRGVWREAGGFFGVLSFPLLPSPRIPVGQVAGVSLTAVHRGGPLNMCSDCDRRRVRFTASFSQKSQNLQPPLLLPQTTARARGGGGGMRCVGNG